jgi:tetratricopeptide (TPR) repeat protein
MKPVIVLTFANDRDNYLYMLNRERKNIFKSLREYDDKDFIQVVKEETASVDDIFELFNFYRDRIVIFHYGGHANGTHLQLETTEGKSQLTNAIGLAQLMGQQKDLILVFLNGCATKKQVELLLNEGVRAVVATSVPIEDEMAVEFAEQFYKALKGQATIENAFKTARAFIKARPGPSREIEIYRHVNWQVKETTAKYEIPWGLYIKDNCQEVLKWKLPSSAQEKDLITRKLIDLERTIALKIDNPAAVQRIKDEYEKKVIYMEETLKNLKTGDKKARDEALKAFKERDFSKARKLFYEIRKKEKEKQKEYALTAYNLGEIYFLELDFKGALAHHLEAESLDPMNTLYQNGIGLVYYTLGEYNKAKDFFEKALTGDLKTYSKEHPSVAIDWNNLGMTYLHLGQYQKAVEYLEKALASNLRTYSKEHPSVAIDWNNLGTTHLYLGQHHKAIEYLEKALASDMKIYGKQHPRVATEYNNLGGAWDSLGNYEKAVEYYEKAHEINIKRLGKEHPNVATTWSNLGGVWDSLGNYEKAVEYYEKALEIDLKNYGKDHPSVANDWNCLGMAFLYLEQHQKAIEYLEKALASDMKTYGKEHPQVATKWNNLGGAWNELGNYEKAIEYFDRALASDIKTYGKEHPSVARDWNNLGTAYDSLGLYQKAIEYLEKALASDLKTYGKDHPSVAGVWSNLGGAWNELGNYEKAIEYYEKALESHLKNYGKDHPKVGHDWNNLGSAWFSLRNHEKAIEYYKKALKNFEVVLGKEHPNIKIVKKKLEYSMIFMELYKKK